MSYRITFSDRSQVTVDNEQGLKLMELQASVKKPEYVNIAENQYKMSTITKVIHTPDQLKTLPMIDSGMVKGCNNAIHGGDTKTLFKRTATGEAEEVGGVQASSLRLLTQR
jgi:hypothetical protein